MYVQTEHSVSPVISPEGLDGSPRGDGAYITPNG